MKSPLYINELEIVGYANVLTEAMLPSVVPPVFRLRADPDQAFVPPYLFNMGCLCNATQLSGSEVKSLAQNREITLFDGPPIEAQRDFELWLDQAGDRHYEPRQQADATLLALAQDYIQKAEEALKNNNMAEVERFCGIAVCADDRLVEPLAIKAVLRRRKNDQTGVQLMVKLAAPMMTERAFLRLVDSYSSILASVHLAPVQAEQTPYDLFSFRIMLGMAKMHAT